MSSHLICLLTIYRKIIYINKNDEKCFVSFDLFDLGYLGLMEVQYAKNFRYHTGIGYVLFGYGPMIEVKHLAWKENL